MGIGGEDDSLVERKQLEEVLEAELEVSMNGGTLRLARLKGGESADLDLSRHILQKARLYKRPRFNRK